MSKGIKLAAILLCIAVAGLAGAPLPSRIALGGKAVVMVADAAYLFPQAPERVVAVAGADQGLGVFLSAIDPGYAAKPVLDRAAGAEAYATLRPDLVVLKRAMKKNLGPSLDALGIKQLYLDLETPEDYMKDIAALGEAFGDRARAAAVTDYYNTALRSVAAKTGSISAGDRPRVLVLQAGAAGGYEVPPASWMQTILAERAGGSPVWKGANPGSGWARVGIEQIAAWDPQAIFVVSYREPSAAVAARLAAEPALASIAAVKGKKVLGFPQDFYSWDQPDTRWILGLEWMAKTLYPDRFASLSIKAEVERFFSFCYGMNHARYEAVVAPKVKGAYGD